MEWVVLLSLLAMSQLMMATGVIVPDKCPATTSGYRGPQTTSWEIEVQRPGLMSAPVISTPKHPASRSNADYILFTSDAIWADLPSTFYHFLSAYDAKGEQLWSHLIARITQPWSTIVNAARNNDVHGDWQPPPQTSVNGQYYDPSDVQTAEQPLAFWVGVNSEYVGLANDTVFVQVPLFDAPLFSVVRAIDRVTGETKWQQTNRTCALFGTLPGSPWLYDSDHQMFYGLTTQFNGSTLLSSDFSPEQENDVFVAAVSAMDGSCIGDPSQQPGVASTRDGMAMSPPFAPPQLALSATLDRLYVLQLKSSRTPLAGVSQWIPDTSLPANDWTITLHGFMLGVPMSLNHSYTAPHWTFSSLIATGQAPVSVPSSVSTLFQSVWPPFWLHSPWMTAGPDVGLQYAITTTVNAVQSSEHHGFSRPSSTNRDNSTTPVPSNPYLAIFGGGASPFVSVNALSGDLISTATAANSYYDPSHVFYSPPVADSDQLDVVYVLNSLGYLCRHDVQLFSMATWCVKLWIVDVEYDSILPDCNVHKRQPRFDNNGAELLIVDCRRHYRIIPGSDSDSIFPDLETSALFFVRIYRSGAPVLIRTLSLDTIPLTTTGYGQRNGGDRSSLVITDHGMIYGVFRARWQVVDTWTGRDAYLFVIDGMTESTPISNVQFVHFYPSDWPDDDSMPVHSSPIVVYAPDGSITAYVSQSGYSIPPNVNPYHNGWLSHLWAVNVKFVASCPYSNATNQNREMCNTNSGCAWCQSLHARIPGVTEVGDIGWNVQTKSTPSYQTTSGCVAGYQFRPVYSSDYDCDVIKISYSGGTRSTSILESLSPSSRRNVIITMSVLVAVCALIFCGYYNRVLTRACRSQASACMARLMTNWHRAGRPADSNLSPTTNLAQHLPPPQVPLRSITHADRLPRSNFGYDRVPTNVHVDTDLQAEHSSL